MSSHYNRTTLLPFTSRNLQLYSSWLVLVPGIGPLRWLRRVGGFIQAAFMLNIALSGNLSFLNHLTIIPALACLDDSCWPKLIRAAEPTSDGSRRWKMSSLLRGAVDAGVLGGVCYLSWPVVSNLLQLDGRPQVMNSSFGSFRLVNTYGAFGSVSSSHALCPALYLNI